MAYLGKTPSQAVRSRYYFTATGGETSLSGTDDNSNTLTFSDGNYVDVALNGVALVAGTDYNTTTANTIGGLTALTASDVVEVIVYDTFSVFSGNFSADIDVTGTVTADGLTVDGSVDVNDSNLNITSNAVNINLYENDTTDVNTRIRQSAGDLFIQTLGDTSGVTNRINLDHATGDISFYASNGTTQGLFWDASTERLGLGATSPSATLTVGEPNATAVSFVSNPVANFGGGVAFDAGSGNDIQLINYRTSNMQFGTGGTVDMTIDSSGNVGIGTTSPSAGLHIDNPDNSAITAILDTDNSAVKMVFRNNTETGNNVQIGADGSNLVANTGGSERMRIASNGTVAIAKTALNNTDEGYIFFNDGYASFVSDANRALLLNRLTSTGEIVSIRQANTTVGSISVTASATSYNTSSDHRLKENAVDMTGAITRVKNLQPKRFNFIADDTDTLVDGFMAHEAQTVVPEAVTGTHNEVDDDNNPVYQGIDQSKLVPLLTGALQEAIAKIETLETEMTALKARVTTLETA